MMHRWQMSLGFVIDIQTSTWAMMWSTRIIYTGILGEEEVTLALCMVNGNPGEETETHLINITF